MRHAALVLLLGLSLTLSAMDCGPEHTPAPAPAPTPTTTTTTSTSSGTTTTVAPIVGGTNVPDSQFPTVGRVGNATSNFCTGTLISPKHVLLAAHCVCDDNGIPNVGKTDARFRLGGQTYSSTDIVVHPSYNGDLEEENILDLAILILDRNVPGVTPTPLYRVAPVAGQVFTIAAYGQVGEGDVGTDDSSPNPPAGTINFGTSPIDFVTATFTKFNYDDREPKEVNTAPGDSGGPCFLTADGVQQLAAVISGGRQTNNGFGDFAFQTRVDIAASWIDAITGTLTTPVYSVRAVVTHGSEIGPFNAQFEVSRTGDLAAAITLTFTLTGTATEGTDYTAIGTTVTIPANTASVRVVVKPVLDSLAEISETVILTLIPATGQTVNPAVALVKILDTDVVRLTSGPTVTPSPPKAKQLASFVCAANLTGATFSWNFGDGSPEAAGPSVTHAFAIGGTYGVSVRAVDALNESSVTRRFNVIVNGFRRVAPSELSKARFTLNLKRRESSSIDVRIANTALIFEDKEDFLARRKDGTVALFVNGDKVDTITTTAMRSKGVGSSFNWNIKKGEINYRFKGAALADILIAAGVKDMTGSDTITLPVFLLVNNGVAFGNDYAFTYKARAGSSATGKSP